MHTKQQDEAEKRKEKPSKKDSKAKVLKISSDASTSAASPLSSCVSVAATHEHRSHDVTSNGARHALPLSPPGP